MGFRLRSLMNVRAPMAADETFLAVQDDYLRRELDARGVVRLSDLRPLCGDLYLWQGDITRLQCGAIVNAANAGMTGCCIPCHACIDNCIHTYAGVQSVAFCCISTGVFRFPNERAAEIAVETVRRYKSETESKVKVIFNVFKDTDREIYERLLGAD